MATAEPDQPPRVEPRYATTCGPVDPGSSGIGQGVGDLRGGEPLPFGDQFALDQGERSPETTEGRRTDAEKDVAERWHLCNGVGLMYPPPTAAAPAVPDRCSETLVRRQHRGRATTSR